MTFQDLMSALPHSVAEHFHNELDKIDIAPGTSRGDVLAMLIRVCSVVESELNFNDSEKTILVEFVLNQLPESALNALFPV